MRKYVLCVPPAFVGGIWCASFSFWLGWAGLVVCLSVVLVLPSFLPSKFLNIIPLPSSSAFFVRAVRHQLALKVVVKKPWNLLCFVCCCWILTTHSFDLFLFFSFFQLHWLTSDQCSFYFTFFNFFFLLERQYRESQLKGGSSNRMATSQKNY